MSLPGPVGRHSPTRTSSFSAFRQPTSTGDAMRSAMNRPTDDRKEAILYEPSWTGGQAFPDQNIVILGISPADIDWGRDAIVHELTHVLVGHLTFSCLGDVPTWLNEGLAVYSEGELDPASELQLEDAIQDNTLLTVRSLSSGFSEVEDKAYLSYSQS